jgi:AcrR family transcriptional regulator
MKARPRLSSDERRVAIIRDVRLVFAENGFHGTTTRKLAEAAKVSEALLFKHFPNKEALFTAMQQSCCNEQDLVLAEQLRAMEPSTSTLVLITHFLISRIAAGCASRDDERVIQNRLMLRSLTEDGEFARVFLRRVATDWVPRFEESIKAAIAAADAVDNHVLPWLAGWFVHHLAVMIMIHLLPARPVIDYHLPTEQLIEQAVLFTLRGMGLTDAAIKRHYNPKALEIFSP